MLYSVMFANAAYTAPREDALALNAEQRIFVAADGVTRDWDAIRTGERAYPDPSPATRAADAAARATEQALNAPAPPDAEAAVRRALEAANTAVHAVNQELSLYDRCDYLEHDLAGAVAAAAIVHGDCIHAGWIGDCGVAILRNGDLVYLTRDQLDPLTAFLRDRPATYDDDRRVFIRRDLRNRPCYLHKGERVSYGVLTGEPDALAFIETATFHLLPGDVVATHTDGFRPYFSNDEFLALLSGDPALWDAELPHLSRRLAATAPEYGRERAVILYRHD